MPYAAFHKNSTRPIPMKSVPSPLGIITTVFQAHADARSTHLKATCMMAKTFSQFPGLEFSFHVATRSHILRCLALILDGPPAQCSCRCSTALEISSFPRILSSTGKGDTSMVIFFSSGGTWIYSFARSAVRVSREICARDGGLLAAYLSHPCIWTHASLTSWGSDSRRYLTVQPDFSSRLFRSVMRPTRIYQLGSRTVRWSPSGRSVTLASMAAQVSSEIQACHTRTLRGD